MEKEAKKLIFNELILLATSFGKKEEETRLKIYTEDLSEYDLESTIQAIRAVRKTCDFFPPLSKIIEKIKSPDGSSEEQAILIANEIIKCISDYGQYQIKEVKEFLGDDKFAIATNFMNWSDLCNIEYDEIPTVRAQLRNSAKSYLDRSKRSYTGGDLKINTSPVQIGDSGLKKLTF